MKHRLLGLALAAAGCVCLPVVAPLAHAAALTRDGFVLPENSEVKIVVFRPDVTVGSLRVGGLDEVNAEWTQAARTNIQNALQSAGETRAANMVFLDEFEGANGDAVNAYRGLFEAVAASIFTHATMGQNLPTKLVPNPDPKARKRYAMDWTLGEGTAQLRDITGGDYAMFLFTKDSYGDAGRKVAQFLMAGIFGAYIPAGVHIGYAALVDLRTGNVVWFNSDLAMGGDPREVEGATKRVGQLLSGFPARGTAIAPSVVNTATPAAQSTEPNPTTPAAR